MGSDLPKGWVVARLGEICHVVTDGTHKTPTYVKAGVRFISIKNIRPFKPVDWDSYERYIPTEEHVALIKRCKPEKDDILFPRIGTLGFAKRIDFDEEVSLFVGLGLAKPIRAVIEPRFLEAYLNTSHVARLSVEKANGSGRLTLPLDESRKFPVPIAPLPEQGRIVAKIEELFSDLDASIAALERVRTNLKRCRAAVLKAAVEGKLTAEWRKASPPSEPADKLLKRILVERRKKWEEAQLARYAAQGKQPPKGWKEAYIEPRQPEPNLTFDLPEGWCWTTVAQTSKVQGGIQKQPKRVPRNNAFPYLRVANVLRNKLDLREIEYFELFEGELERLRLEHGDMLVVEGNGSRSEIGRSAIWRAEIENCVHQNHLIRVRFEAGLPEYLNTYWNSPNGTRKVMQKAASTSGLYTLSTQKVSELPLPLPPMEEQQQIMKEVDARLSVILHAEVEINSGLSRATRLRQSILKRAFEGKLVPQDPNDEPASVLLERIRAARSVHLPPVKVSRRKARKKA